jgi:hypothetical protein
MGQQQKLGKHKTNVRQENGVTIIRYHKTDIIQFDDNRIVLDTGGWNTATTKSRMNQASNQFGLGYHVYQEDYSWYVDYKGFRHPFGCFKILKRGEGYENYG